MKVYIVMYFQSTYCESNKSHYWSKIKKVFSNLELVNKYIEEEIFKYNKNYCIYTKNNVSKTNAFYVIDKKINSEYYNDAHYWWEVFEKEIIDK